MLMDGRCHPPSVTCYRLSSVFISSPAAFFAAFFRFSRCHANVHAHSVTTTSTTCARLTTQLPLCNAQKKSKFTSGNSFWIFCARVSHVQPHRSLPVLPFI